MIFIVVITLTWMTNYLVDPFNVFHTKVLKVQFQENERFIKTEFLEKHYNDYNSYMFGSSRIGTTHPSVLNQYIEDASFYNFTITAANFYDYLIHLKYFIKRQYPVENLYLQIDIDNMSSYGRSSSNYLMKPHPYVTNNSKEMFYLQYLSGFFPFNVKGKIKMNIKPENFTLYDMHTGTWINPDIERKIENNLTRYIQEEPTFHENNERTMCLNKIEQTIIALKEIRNICIENNINLYVFTTPHHKNLMDVFVIKDYLQFLKLIAEVTDFYDFSGYNTITLENKNYYEHSHYRPHIGELVAARIFDDKSVNIPNDFGVLVTKENIDEYLVRKMERINNYDLRKH